MGTNYIFARQARQIQKQGLGAEINQTDIYAQRL